MQHFILRVISRSKILKKCQFIQKSHVKIKGTHENLRLRLRFGRLPGRWRPKIQKEIGVIPKNHTPKNRTLFGQFMAVFVRKKRKKV